MSSINLTTADTTAGIPALAPVAPMNTFAAAPGVNAALVPYVGPGHIVAPGAVAAPGPMVGPAPIAAMGNAAAPAPAAAPALVGPQPPPPANLPHRLITDRRAELNVQIVQNGQNGQADRHIGCPPNVHKNYWHRLLNRADSQLRKLAHVRYTTEPTNTKTALKVARAYRLLAYDLCNARSNSPDRRLRDLFHTRTHARREFFNFMIMHSLLIDHSNHNIWTASRDHCE